MEHKILLKKIELVTHNVLHLVTEKPKDYSFTPGQATELSIDKEGFREQKRPFTFTNLPTDNELEFTIKMYPSHDGVTEQLGHLEVGDTLLIGDAWGAIKYEGEGAFIAGGAGITPFISILKDLNRQGNLNGHTLFFANKTEKDIIYKKNLEAWLGDAFHNILSEENHETYPHGYIDKEYLNSKGFNTSQKVYLCGPPPMMDALQSELYAMDVSKKQLVAEELS
ncbi:ferredoxin reductase domain-containing protein [Pareuzebyella sediminis]|uniref:flavodoxin reductase n=1 Tax=Pareuzebyella sediminis TaxID=2607998 RepID=UPI0011EC6F79|nr:flavodoxin reductase [Pareuzebyella sediminis]